MLTVSACGGAASTPGATSPGGAAVSAAATTAAPSVAPVAESTSPAPTTATNKTYESDLGASITLPGDWVAITPKDVTNPNVLVPLRTKAGPEAINALVSTLRQHPEYWLAALRPSDGSVLTAQIREAVDFEAWGTEQEAALEGAYKDVERTELAAPAPGVRFSFTSGDYASRLYGFERPGGVAIFTLAGRPTAAVTWDDAVAGYTE